MSYNRPIQRIAIVGTGVIGAGWVTEYLAGGSGTTPCQEDISTNHLLRGVFEREGSNTLAGVALARGDRPVFAELKKYDATTHLVGQSAIFTLSDDRAAGEATAWRITLRRTVESDACCSPGSATSTHL